MRPGSFTGRPDTFQLKRRTGPPWEPVDDAPRGVYLRALEAADEARL